MAAIGKRSALLPVLRAFHLRCKLRKPVVIGSDGSAGGAEPTMRIFSGIQPTGFPHLGNYFGAIRQWVRMQEAGHTLFLSIVDLHAITLPQDPNDLRRRILEMAASLLACGVDPKRSVLFQQSTISQHAALGWVLGCLTTMPRLGQIPTYKEKAALLKEVPLGLYVYPVLQSADVLLYKATHVPVGEDQLANVQLAQHLARAFNKRYGEVFPVPRAVLADDDRCRVGSLRDPAKKMSKSDPDPKSRIELFDGPDAIREKLRKAVTDFTSEVTYDPERRPAIANLIDLHGVVTGLARDEICSRVRHLDTLHYKMAVAEAVVDFLAPVRGRIEELLREPGYVVAVLGEGARRAEVVAEETWASVRDRVGFL